MEGTRYDEIAAWYDETFRASLTAAEANALERLFGQGDGRCLDLGCGTGVEGREYPYKVGLRCRR